MDSHGNSRLAWQSGSVALYADVTVEIKSNNSGYWSILGIESIAESWRDGVRFGFSLIRETLTETIDSSGLEVTVTAFKSQPSDTTVSAAAYATFHAIADALELRLDGVFSFDKVDGRFAIAIPNDGLSS